MTSVFIGGSRRLTRLNSEVRVQLDRIIARQARVLIGDANGADKAVQTYLHARRYPDVTVYCTGGACRNNVGGWQTKTVEPPHRTRDFEFFTAKDAAMAREADAGLMLWDGDSTGTMVNVARLVATGKPAAVYISPARRFQTLRSRGDLDQLLSACSTEVRSRISESIDQHAREYVQPSIF